jgi:hypothetical protein
MTTEEYKNLYNHGTEFANPPLREPGHYLIRSNRMDTQYEKGPIVRDIAQYFYNKHTGLWSWVLLDTNLMICHSTVITLHEEDVLVVGPKIEMTKDW